jgi:hypothetical protein
MKHFKKVNYGSSWHSAHVIPLPLSAFSTDLAWLIHSQDSKNCYGHDFDRIYVYWMHECYFWRSEEN